MKIKNQQEIATPSACRKSHTRLVVYIATMVAISIVLKLLSNSLSQALPAFLKISLAYLGWYMAAAALGPWAGAAVAVLSDLIGQWAVPTGGAPNPVLLIGNGLNALIFGAVFNYVRFPRLPAYADMLLRTVIGAAAAALICTLGVNTWGLWFYYYSSTNYWAFTASRLTQLVAVAVNIVLFAGLIPVLGSIGLLPPRKNDVKQASCEIADADCGQAPAENTDADCGNDKNTSE